MDTGLGDLALISEDVANKLKEKGLECFEQGEEVKLKGSSFRIECITNNGLWLRILPDESAIKAEAERAIKDKTAQLQKEMEKL
jgi:hypothetical protein